jgi:hypothetical protein
MALTTMLPARNLPVVSLEHALNTSAPLAALALQMTSTLPNTIKRNVRVRMSLSPFSGYPELGR